MIQATVRRPILGRTGVRRPRRFWRLSALVLVSLSMSALACDRIQAELAGSERSGAESDHSSQLAETARPEGASSIGPGSARRLYYQYVDARGGVRFTERLDEVPPEWRDRVGFVELEAPPPLSPADARRTREQAYARNTGPSAARAARLAAASAPTRSEPEVALYWASWCGYCKRAQAHLDSRGVSYDLRDIDRPQFLEELVERTGQRGVPVIDVDGRVLIGWDPGRLDQLLAAAS